MEPVRSTGFYQSIEKSRAFQVMGFIPVVQQLVGVALFLIGLGEFIKGKTDLPKHTTLHNNISVIRVKAEEEGIKAKEVALKIIGVKARIKLLEEELQAPQSKEMDDFIHRRLISQRKELGDLEKIYHNQIYAPMISRMDNKASVLKSRIKIDEERIEDGKRSMLVSIATIIPFVGSIFWGRKLRS